MARDERETRRLIGGTIFTGVFMFLAGLLIIFGFGFSACQVNPAVANQQGKNDNNIVKAEASMDSLEEVKLNAEAKAVDLSKQASVSAGGNINNDSILIAGIFDNFVYIVGALFTFLAGIIGTFIAAIKYVSHLKNQTIKTLMNDKSETERRMDKFQNELINKLVNGRSK